MVSRANASTRMIDAFRGTRYESRMRELIGDRECTVVENVNGVLVYSPIAGANEVIKLHWLHGDIALPEARFLIAELPDDAPWHEMTTALLVNGFREEGRINDFV